MKKKRWRKPIHTFSDLLQFRQFIVSMNQKSKTSGDREFPAVIVVTDEAYNIVREKVLLQHKRSGNAFWYGAKAVFSGGSTLVSDVIKQIFDYGSEAYADRGKEVTKAASAIAAYYSNVLEDKGTKLRLAFVWNDDNPHSDPPTLY